MHQFMCSPDRYASCARRVHLSDGELMGFGVLTGELTKLVMTDVVKLNALVRLKEYVVNQLGPHKMCIVMKMQVVEDQYMDLRKIGDPIMWDTVPAADSPQQSRPFVCVKADKGKNGLTASPQIKESFSMGRQGESAPSEAGEVDPLQKHINLHQKH